MAPTHVDFYYWREISLVNRTVTRVYPGGFRLPEKVPEPTRESERTRANGASYTPDNGRQ